MTPYISQHASSQYFANTGKVKYLCKLLQNYSAILYKKTHKVLLLEAK